MIGHRYLSGCRYKCRWHRCCKGWILYQGYVYSGRIQFVPVVWIHWRRWVNPPLFLPIVPGLLQRCTVLWQSDLSNIPLIYCRYAESVCLLPAFLQSDSIRPRNILPIYGFCYPERWYKYCCSLNCTDHPFDGWTGVFWNGLLLFFPDGKVRPVCYPSRWYLLYLPWNNKYSW